MKKILLGIMIAAVAIGCAAYAVSSETAYAGTIKKTLLDDSFAGAELDTASWYSGSGTGISLGEGYVAYSVKSPWTGTGLSSKITVSDGGAMEVDITRLNWGGNSGNLWLVFGDYAENFPNDVWDTQNADGIKINYNKDAEPYALRLSSQYSTVKGLVDGNGDALATPTPYAFTDVTALADESAADRITSKTLRFEYGADGSFQLKMKELGSSEEFAVVAKTTQAVLRPFTPNSRAWVFFDEAGGAVEEGEIRDIRVYDKDGHQLSSFGADPAASYNVYKNSSTAFASLGMNQYLVFNEDYRNGNPLFVSKEVYAETDNEIAESVATVETKLALRSWKGDKRFGLLLGAKKQSSGKIGEASSSYLYITLRGGSYYYGMETYNAAGENSVVIKERALPAAAEDFTLKLEVGSRGLLRVSFDGVADYSDTDAVFAYAGYFGFAADGAQTDGENQFKILVDSFLLKNEYYDRPANTNIKTDFANNEFNTKLWQLSSKPYMSTYTNGVYVKDEMLWFDNVAMNSYIATQYQYSDFELQYSVTDVRREAVKDEASGEALYPVSSWIGTVFGASTPNDDFGKMVNSIPLVYFEVPIDKNTWEREKDSNGENLPARVVLSNVGTNRMIDLPDKYDFWALENAGKVLNVSIRMKDLKLTVSLKYSTETKFTVVAEQTLPSGVSGHIYICGMGDSYFVEDISEGATCGNFVLDDISVTNLDNKGNILTDVGFESNKNGEIPGDAEDAGSRNEAEYRPSADSGSGGCSGQIEACALVSVVSLLAAALIAVKRKRV